MLTQNNKIPVLTHEVPLREVMFGIWCFMSATKTTGRSRFMRFCSKATGKFRPFFEFTRYFSVERDFA